MENISIKISLEPQRTRLPLVFPSLIDGEVNYVLSGSTLESRKNGNYGGIPLNLEPKIVGYLNRFTPEMANKYGNYEKVFSYSEILEIMTFFQRYYSYIYSNETVYDDMQDYVNSIDIISESEKKSLVEMDRTFKEYGGNKFYKWLLDYYFGMIDFRMEYINYYNEPVSYEWSRCVDNLPSVLYYVDAIEFYQRICQMHDKYKNIDNVYKCPSTDSCCECAEYFSYGGNMLYDILGAWLKRMNNNLEFLKNVDGDNVSSMGISINLTRKVEDLGNYTMLSCDFIAGNEYNVGNVCTYDNDVYILRKGKGYVIDPLTDAPVFDTDGWVKYITVCKEKDRDMGFDVDDLPEDYVISGRTVSMLEDFLVYTMDAMGNALPGRYELNINSYCPHPAENSFIELPFHIGDALNLEQIGENVYHGDLLYGAHFYPCDSEGNEVGNSRIDVYSNESMLEAINKAIDEAHKMEYWDEVIGVDFEYYKDAEVIYANGYLEPRKRNGHTTGVKCIDKCRLEPKNTLYYLNSDESYPIRYYEVSYDVETRLSEVYDREVNYKMCDFYLYPQCYEDNYNNLVASPLFRKDETIGFSGPEKVVDNIYIDRGYATILDRHLKICEVSSLDEITAYGNGSFDVINLETQG